MLIVMNMLCGLLLLSQRRQPDRRRCRRRQNDFSREGEGGSNFPYC